MPAGFPARRHQCETGSKPGGGENLPSQWTREISQERAGGSRVFRRRERAGRVRRVVLQVSGQGRDLTQAR